MLLNIISYAVNEIIPMVYLVQMASLVHMKNLIFCNIKIKTIKL